MVHESVQGRTEADEEASKQQGKDERVINNYIGIQLVIVAKVIQTSISAPAPLIQRIAIAIEPELPLAIAWIVQRCFLVTVSIVNDVGKTSSGKCGGQKE
jgi:hypothetical protein